MGSIDWGIVLLQFVVFALAVTVHESAHAWSADRLGDPTARLLGRISFNPLVHADLFGSLIFPVLLAVSGLPVFGWAKPVPVNPMNLRRPRRDSAWVSAAGPLSNIALALVAVVLFRLLVAFDIQLIALAGKDIIVGLALFLRFSAVINLILAAFNLIPIPPLDGGGILAGLLPYRMLGFLDFIRPYGFMILILLLMSRVINAYVGLVVYVANFMLGMA